MLRKHLEFTGVHPKLADCLGMWMRTFDRLVNDLVTGSTCLEPYLVDWSGLDDPNPGDNICTFSESP